MLNPTIQPSNPLEAMLFKYCFEEFKIGNFKGVIQWQDWELPNPMVFAKMMISSALFYGVKLHLTKQGIRLENTSGSLNEVGEELVHASLRTLSNNEVFKLPLIQGEDNE